MKRSLLLLSGLLLGFSIKAQEARITATGTVGEQRTITIGLNGAGTVKLDWGDGTLVEKTTTQAYDEYDGSAEFTGIPANEGIIKIYGEGIVYFGANGKFNADKTDIPNALTALDVTKATDLTEIAVNANKLTALDLSKNTSLAKLNIANNQFESINLNANTELVNLTANDNLLTELDLSKNAKLTTMVLSNNKLKTLDFTNNPLVKTITCLNNELTSVTFGENTASKHTIQFGGNKLTTINLSGFTDFSGTYLRLRDNELTEIVLPGKINQIWADGNHFTLAQLYALQMLSQIKNFTYATSYTKEYAQAPYEIPEKIDVNGTVDLSSQATLGPTATNFTWKTADGTTLVEGTDYTVSNGVFTFLTGQEAIHCEMTNAELPAFTAAKPYVTTTMKVEGTTSIQSVTDGESNGNSVWYNLNGQRVAQPTQKGLYIRSGKKLIVK